MPKAPLSRRQLIQAGLFSTAGMTMPLAAGRLLADRAEDRTADSVLFINLTGGPSHLETLDMKPEGPVELRGEFKTIQTKLPGLQASEYLPRFAAAADQYALIRGISHTTGDHPQGQLYIGTGNRPTPALKYPALGSIVAKERGTDPALPPFISVPLTDWNAGYMGDSYAPFNTNVTPKKGKPFIVRGITIPEGVSVDRIRKRSSLLADLNTRFKNSKNNPQLTQALSAFGRQAEAMQLSDKTRSAFDIAGEPKAYQDLFDDSELSQSLLLATRLLGFGVPFVTVRHTGWDTHLDNFKGHRRLVPQIDNGLASAVAGLKAKGLLERTLVVVMGEFGRTPKINKNVGRDHYPRVNFCVLTGGGIKPGQVLGATDAGGQSPTDGTNFKPDDIAATILHTLGIDHHKEYYTSTKRPVLLVPHGRVINDVLA